MGRVCALNDELVHTCRAECDKANGVKRTARGFKEALAPSEGSSGAPKPPTKSALKAKLRTLKKGLHG